MVLVSSNHLVSRSGRVILLLRGLIRERRHWGDFAEQLQAQFPNRTVLSFNLPGNGHLVHLRSPRSITAMRQSLRIQLRLSSLNTDKIDVVAISLGGMVAVDWQAHFPEEINSITLINSSNASFSPFYQRLRWQSLGKILSILFTVNRFQRQLKILQLTSCAPMQHLGVLVRWLSWSEQYPVTWQNSLRQLWAAARFRCTDKPKVATLLLSSRQDKLVDCRCSEVLATHWQCEHKQHPSAGHDLPLDDAEWTVNQLSSWLSLVDPS